MKISIHRDFKYSAICTWLVILVSSVLIHSCVERNKNKSVEKELLFSFGSDGFDEGYDLAVDNEGNIVICGVFGGKGGFSFLKSDSSVVSNGGYDLFVVKYSNDGQLIWSKTIGAAGWDELSAVKIDNKGQIYVCGFFNGSIGYDQNKEYKSIGGNDAVAFCLSSDGVIQWMKTVGSRGDDEFTDVLIDTAGDVWLAGAFSGPLTIDHELNSDLSYVGNKDIMLIQFDQQGNLKKSYSFGSAREELCNKFSEDESRIILTGGYRDKITIGEKSISAKNEMDYFVLEMDLTGNVKKLIGSDEIGTEVVNSIVCIDNQYVISGQQDKLQGNESDAFVSLCSADGSPKWKIDIASNKVDWAKGLVNDKTSNKIMASIVFQDTVMVQGIKYISKGNYDILILNIGMDGKISTIEQIGDTGEDGINILKMDKGNNLYCTGWFSDKPHFGKEGTQIESRPVSDVFVYRKQVQK